MRTLTLLLTLVMSTLALTADDEKTDKKVTGCLMKGSGGEYTLTDAGGTKIAVVGSPDLEKHSANHKVTLHGKSTTEGGKNVFRVDRVEHIADTCSVQAPQ